MRRARTSPRHLSALFPLRRIFFSTTITVTTNEELTLQTYGFGGGTNQNGIVIPAGGTDPFVGLFFGTGAGATFINGTSLDLTNYSSFVACPPANSVSNFGGTTS